MFSPWSLVSRHYWDPISQLEQSIYDIERLTGNITGTYSSLPSSVLYNPLLHEEDDDFFRDLPIGTTSKSKKQQAQPQRAESSQPKTMEKTTATESTETTKKTPMSEAKAESTPEPPSERLQRQFNSYSYSSSSVIDEKGQRVQSIRRRYEDSRGRLKAQHERTVGDKVVKNLWSVTQPGEEGKFTKSIMGNVEEEEFEKLWEETPFAKAAREKCIVPKDEEKARDEPSKKSTETMEESEEETNMKP